ncbi:DNA mismatch repair endonuclease MutH [hydrothermal vent metagenome]|uniref:DNA mismatch repair endonuclease MutH n=1 Tax=hydrothermal vent metagenome TaxID=652676 RepID=A0A3B1AGP0_9ZZZZ
MDHTLPPKTQHELIERTRTIAGLTLGELAQRQHLTVPAELLHAKGWIGQLIEQALGATAGSRAKPDFAELGIELKTIPLNAQGRPKETTYVCTVPLNEAASSWEDSWIRRKLNHVLWLPIEADADLPVSQRRIGSAILTQLNSEQDQQLKQDWLEHMELIATGRINEISAHHGTYLQVRPKAANNKALRDTTDEDGQSIKTLPRGFYLRTKFTAEILNQHYAI